MLGQTATTIIEIRALELALQAIGHITTGQPALETFDQVEVEAAADFFFWEHRAVKGSKLGKSSDAARSALVELHWRIKGAPRLRLSGEKQKAELVEAGAILAARLEETRQSEDVYWAAFARDAMEEAEAIVGKGR